MLNFEVWTSEVLSVWEYSRKGELYSMVLSVWCVGIPLVAVIDVRAFTEEALCLISKLRDAKMSPECHQQDGSGECLKCMYVFSWVFFMKVVLIFTCGYLETIQCLPPKRQ